LGLSLGHFEGWHEARGPPGVTDDRTPHHYHSPVASRTGRAPLLSYRFGPKPKRRTELGLLLFGSLLVVALYVIAALGQKSKIPDNIGAFLGIVLGLALIAHMANRWLAPNANAVILPLAALLNGIGYVIIARWDPGQARGQAAWAALGVMLYVLTLLVVRYSRDLERYRYLLLLLAGILLVAPLFFSPILDPRPLLPILVAWGAAMAIIGLEDDIGFAALLFVLFIGLLWVATGRVGYLVLGLVLFGVGAYVAARYFGQVHLRVEQWQNPWPSAGSGDSQLAQAQYSLGTGGVGGTGLGFDHYAGYIFGLTSDMVFAAIGTEMGLIGCAAVVVAFILLVGSGFRVAQTARSDFSRLMATGLTLSLGFQAFFIMAGVVRILPFTGITLPFVAYGGSSLLANYILIALLLRISDEGAQAQTLMRAVGDAAAPGESPMVPAR
jgi:cell division protein FtsW (lipid II flippase)